MGHLATPQAKDSRGRCAGITAPVDDEPVPRNRGGRWVAAAIVFAVSAVVAWTIWDRHAWRCFEAEVSRMRAEGEPVWETDFPKARVPDSENAAVLLRRAATEMVETPEELSHYQDNFFLPPLTPEAVQSLGRILEANHAALTDVRQAEGLSATDWGPLPTSDRPLFSQMEEFNHLRWLAQLLGFAARHAHATGDDHAAIGFVREMLVVARATDADESTTPHLVAEGMRAMAFLEFELLAPDLRVGDRQGDARRAEVGASIAGLLDAESRRQSLRRAIEHERPAIAAPGTEKFTRLFRHADVQFAPGGEYSHSLAPRALDVVTDRIARPVFLLRAARLLRHDAAVAAVAPAADSGALPPAVARRRRDDFHLLDMFGVHWVTAPGISDWDISRAFRIHRNGTFDNARAAVSLATRLYQIDHDGQLPAGTASLVPIYLPALPGVPAVPAYGPSGKASPIAPPATVPTTVPAATQPGLPQHHPRSSE